MRMRNWKRGFRIMFAVVVIGSLLSPTPLWAQGASAGNANKNQWSSLENLRVGDKIRVVQTDAKVWKGRFLALSDEAISLRVNGKAITIERPKVLRVESWEKNKRLHNALIGMAIGGGIGLAIGIPLGRMAESGEEHLPALVLGSLGAGIGAGSGAAVPGHPTIYQANPTPKLQPLARPTATHPHRALPRRRPWPFPASERPIAPSTATAPRCNWLSVPPMRPNTPLPDTIPR